MDRQSIFRLCALGLVLALGGAGPPVGAAAAVQVSAAATPASCPVTHSDGSTPPGLPAQPDGYGNGRLWTQLWPDGRVVFVPGVGFVEADGSLAMKWPWWRGGAGPLRVTGRRLDGPASPLRWIPDGGGDGFQASELVFPSAGCWEVTARAGEASLTVVTWVEAAAGSVAARAPAPGHTAA